MPSKRAIVERLNFGLWTNASVRWLPADLWSACGTVPIDREALAGRACVLGVDLGESHDLTSVVALFGDEPLGYDVLPFYFIAEDNLDARARSDRAPYRQWVDDGLIEAVPGPIVRFDVVGRRIEELASQYDVREIAIDKWRARQLEQRLLDAGLPVVEVPPTAVNIAPAAAALERLLKTGAIRHGNHPVLAWNASNCVADVDPVGNVRPSKVRSGGRIDGISALVVALVRATQQPSTTSVYDTRGPLWLDPVAGEVSL
jgi:phage terminase large subunit-like protein